MTRGCDGCSCHLEFVYIPISKDSIPHILQQFANNYHFQIINLHSVLFNCLLLHLAVMWNICRTSYLLLSSCYLLSGKACHFPSTLS